MLSTSLSTVTQIESDDALSSILEVTRHVRLGEAAYGLGPESRLSECASMLEFDADAMPDEDITISTIPSVPVHSSGLESDKSDSHPTSADTPDRAEEFEQADSIQNRFAVIPIACRQLGADS